MTLNLDDFIEGTQSFRYREALTLQKWNVTIFPSSDQLKKIIQIAQPLQYFRNRYGKPIIIHSWLRIKPYNELVGGSKNSWHLSGGAVDFSVATMNCDEIRNDLIKHLERLNIRCERLEGSNWIHIDNKPVRPDDNRYFYPLGSLG